MNMVYYDSAGQFINSKATAKQRIAAIDLVITSLITLAATAATNENIEEYQLNDGQTTIKTVYRGISSIERSIESMERLKNMYMNQANGRVRRMVHGKNFIGPRDGR